MSDSARVPGKYSLFKSLAGSIAASAILLSGSISVYAETHENIEAGLEKEDLKFGFIKLTDMAPLTIAYENVELAVKQVFGRSNSKQRKSKAEMRQWIEHNLHLVYMDHAMHKRLDEKKTEAAEQDEETQSALSVVAT